LYTSAQGGRTNRPDIGTPLELTQSRWSLEQLLDLALQRCGMTVPAISDKCLNSVLPHNQPNAIGKGQSSSPLWTHKAKIGRIIGEAKRKEKKGRHEFMASKDVPTCILNTIPWTTH
jgi:hypothetical protein